MDVGKRTCGTPQSIDLNRGCSNVDPFDDAVSVNLDTAEDVPNAAVSGDLDSDEAGSEIQFPGSKRNRGTNGSRPSSELVLYEDSGATRGGAVKAAGDVLRVRNMSCERGPYVICKVELFGKLVASFDGRKNGWVSEMGFGGMLNLVGLKLPRSLCYWLMTRIDPVNERLNVGGLSFRFSCNQVRWVLGIPKGGKRVPVLYPSQAAHNKVLHLERLYGQEWSSVEGRSGRVLTRRGLSVSPVVTDRLSEHFEEDEEEEFKTLFLMAVLDMVLCPTQSNRFPKELLPALTCALDAPSYNWCSLVLERLMASVKRFAARFYSDGYATGCGGCTLFVAILYLDRLNRKSLDWGDVPRIKVWSDVEVKKACDEDRVCEDGDFGALGVLDVAYGEKHPYDARDGEYPLDCAPSTSKNPLV